MSIFNWFSGSSARSLAADLITAANANARADAGDLIIVDVRMPEEWAASGMAKGAEGVTLGAREFEDRVSDLAAAHPRKTLAMICKSGMRAKKAAKIAQSYGLTQVAIVEGGMEAWAKARLPTTPFSQS